MTFKLKKITAILCSFLLLCLLACSFLYLNAKKVATNFVKPYEEYFLLQPNFFCASLVPVSDSKRAFSFNFEFCNLSAFDACFEIFVSPLGEVIATNPRDLIERLENVQHVYPKISEIDRK